MAQSSRSVDASVRVTTSDGLRTADGRIAAGSDHTCVISDVNVVWCWGSNANRQLGVSASVVSAWRSSPVQSTALPNSRVPVQIVAGLNHTCVRASDGTVWCWGDNGFGQLGNGGSGTASTPQQVVLPQQATHLAAGGANTCAVLSDDSLYCWGRNDVGQVGIGSTVSPQTLPQQVTTVPSTFVVDDIEIGDFHVCASSRAGGLWCWGLWADGRLGSSSQSDAWLPRATASLVGSATSPTAGQSHTCVVVASVTIKCFGSNSSGQLGQSTSTPSNDVPTAVTFGDTVETVTAGSDFTCGLSTTGAVKCFGSNHTGQLANGSTSFTPRTEALAVTGLGGDRIVTVAAGDLHACAVVSTGAVKCWGSNDYGQVGVETSRAPQLTAATVGALTVVPTTTVAPTIAPTVPPTIAPTVAPTMAPTLAPPAIDPSSSTTPISAPLAPAVETTPRDALVTTTTAFSQGIRQTSTTTIAKRVVVRSLTLRRGQTVSAQVIAAAVSMKVPKTSKGSMRIAITSGQRRCVFRGSVIVATQVGTCTVSVTMMPKVGKHTTRHTVISVR